MEAQERNANLLNIMKTIGVPAEIPTMTEIKYCMTENEINKSIDIIIKNFDFEKVHKVMTFLKWTYFDGPPSIERLKQSARNILLDLYRHNTYYVGCGGFEARRINENLELSFSIAQMDNDRLFCQ